jgi:RNA polymerase sigma-70 factor (ECF subfamily)
MTSADDHATARTWAEFGKRLRGYLRRQLPTAADADDVLQEVFVRVHRHAGELESRTDLAAWLFAIARSAVIDHRRRASVRAGVGPDRDEEPDEAALTVHADIAAGLRRLVSELPGPYARAVTLVDLEGRSMKEAADALGLSVSGAKSRVQRGRALVRDALLRCCHFVVDRYGIVLDARPWCCCCPEDAPVPLRPRR